jgi:hypothetical protein
MLSRLMIDIALQDHVPEAISKFNSYENTFFSKVKGSLFFFVHNDTLFSTTNTISLKSICFLLNFVILRGVAHCQGPPSCCHWTYSHCRTLPHARSPLLFHSSTYPTQSCFSFFFIITSRQSLMYVFLSFSSLYLLLIPFRILNIL